MKTFKLIGMALLAVVMSISFIACSSDNDDNKDNTTSLSGTTWKVVSVDNAGSGFKNATGTTATFNSDGTVTFTPSFSWTYARWTLNGNTLKIVVGQGHADDYMEGTLSISGNSGTWDAYWGDANSDRSGKDAPHAIVHLQKQ